MAGIVYSIGHSNKPIEDFIKELKALNINILVDLRSQPYSGYVPQFNRENLKGTLEDEKIKYLYYGDKLGGRPPEGIDNFIKSERFRNNISGLLLEIEGVNSALMCTELDQATCHRRFVVEEIEKRGIKVVVLGGSSRVENKKEKNGLKQLSLGEF